MLAAAPRASCQLVGRSHARHLRYRLPRNCGSPSAASSVRFGVVRRPTHRPMRNGVFAPTVIAVLQGLPADRFAGTHQGRWPAGTAGWSAAAACTASARPCLLANSARHGALQPPQPHRVGGQAQVGSRSCRRPWGRTADRPGPLGFRPVLVVEFGDARQVQQDEGDLEGIPATGCRACRSLCRSRAGRPDGPARR